MEALFHIYDKTALGVNISKALEKDEKRVVGMCKLFFFMTVITLVTLTITRMQFSNNRKLLFPIWVPFDIHHNNLYYLLVFAYEIIYYVLGIGLASIMCVVFIGLGTFHLTILHLVGETIERIDQLTESELRRNKKKAIQDTVEHVIGRAIRHHVTMCR